MHKYATNDNRFPVFMKSPTLTLTPERASKYHKVIELLLPGFQLLSLWFMEDFLTTETKLELNELC